MATESRIFLVAIAFSLFFLTVLPHIVIPGFSRRLSTVSELNAWRFALSVSQYLGGALVLLAAVAIWQSKPLTHRLCAPGFDPAAVSQAQRLLVWSCPILVVMSWSGVINGILQSYGVFWADSIRSGGVQRAILLVAIYYFGTAGSSDALVWGMVAGAILTFGLYTSSD